MIVTAIRCNAECEDIIYSRVGHDFRRCSCGHCAIDGGFDYTKVTGLFFTFGELEINTTKTSLYADWDKSHDKYGKISKDEQQRLGISLKKTGIQYTDGDTEIPIAGNNKTTV